MNVFVSLKKEPSSFACTINSSDSPLSNISKATLPKNSFYHHFTSSWFLKKRTNQGNKLLGIPHWFAMQAAAPALTNLPKTRAKRLCCSSRLWLGWFMPIDQEGTGQVVAPYVQVLNTFNGACASQRTAMPDAADCDPPAPAQLTATDTCACPQVACGRASGLMLSLRRLSLCVHVARTPWLCELR